MLIRLEPKTFDPHAALADFTRAANGAGAAASFLGLVRRGGDKPVRALFIDHFPGLTEKAIAETAAMVRGRWGLIDALLIHRVGEVEAGEPVVLVAAAAAHRRQAFEACDFLMDYLKTDAPFWKKELFEDGDAAWIAPRAGDYDDRARWGEFSEMA